MVQVLVTLSSQERAKFVSWLDQEAESDNGMAMQLELLPDSVVTSVLFKKYKAESIAARMIAKKLRSIQEETL